MTSRPAEAHEPSYSKYTAGCRCPGCREANRAYHASARERRRNNPALADRAGHGKQTTYDNYACRCAACRAAHAEKARNQRARQKGGAR